MKRYMRQNLCEISDTFSEVVICRRFRPAGGQPLFRVFLRLPDHNPLKRLEAFFRVISLGGEEGVRLIQVPRRFIRDAKHLRPLSYL